jgi:hypothetical protein
MQFFVILYLSTSIYTCSVLLTACSVQLMKQLDVACSQLALLRSQCDGGSSCQLLLVCLLSALCGAVFVALSTDKHCHTCCASYVAVW